MLIPPHPPCPWQGGAKCFCVWLFLAFGLPLSCLCVSFSSLLVVPSISSLSTKVSLGSCCHGGVVLFKSHVFFWLHLCIYLSWLFKLGVWWTISVFFPTTKSKYRQIKNGEKRKEKVTSCSSTDNSVLVSDMTKWLIWITS